MTLLTSIIPFIIVLVIFVSIAIIINKVSTYRGKFAIITNGKWLFGGYIAILLISVVLYYTIPIEKFASESNDIEEEVKKAEKAGYEIYDAALKGNVDQVEAAYIKEQWEFNFDNEQLNIQTGNNFMVFVEKIESEENIFEVAYYTTNTIIDDFVITDEFPSPKVLMEGSTLKVIKPELIEMKFGKFTQEFPIRQFSSEKMFDEDFRHIHGTQLLYLRVPKNIRVTGEATIVEEN